MISMEKQVYERVIIGDIQAIMDLRNRGAELEWRDHEGKTPLILACQRHDRFDVAKVLIDFGANVNAYQPGNKGGTPLHHAIMKGFGETVNLLLANGANPFIKNDDDYAALDLARQRGRFIIVRSIESHISIFSGWLRAERASGLTGDFSPIPSDFRPGKVWAVVLPSDTIDLTRPLKLELVMYQAPEVALPFEVIKLTETHIDQPNFNKPDPFVVIEPSGTRYKLFSEYWGKKQQIKLLYNACQGVLEANDLNTTPSPNQVSINPPSAQHIPVSRSTHLANSTPEQPPVPRTIPVSAPLTNSVSSPRVHGITPTSTGTNITSARPTEAYLTDPEDIELAQAIKASIQTAIAEGVYIEPYLIPETSTTGTSLSFDHPVLQSDTTSEETFYDASPKQAILTSTIFNDMSTEISGSIREEREVQENDLCVVCLDSKVEAACIPCGHMAGCLACFKKIEARSKQCPVCRARVDQVVKIYTI